MEELQRQFERLKELKKIVEDLKQKRDEHLSKMSGPPIAIIIEHRRHGALSFVVRNVLENLDWNVLICYGIFNKNFVENLLETELSDLRSRITLKKTDWGESRNFLNRKFVEEIPSETFLLFQVNSMINPNSKDLIKKFMKYDYVGAPWKHGGTGHGGFSLRKRSKMLEILQGLHPNHKIPYEDLVYSMGSAKVKPYKPTFDEAKEFCLHTVYSEIFFAVHKAWEYNEDKIEDMCERCPGLRTLISLQGVFEPCPTLSFVSYADDNFKGSKDRIKSEAEAMGCFDGEIKIYGPEDLSADFRAGIEDTLKLPRGGGYWLWKPYILKEIMSKMRENDYVLYADAGCTLQSAGIPRLKEYIEMISPESGKSVLCMRLVDGFMYGKDGFLQKKWTVSPIFDYFGVPVESGIGNSNQILSGLQIYRKCAESMAILEKMCHIATTRPDLFTDEHNDESKKTNPAFIENRHDQAVLTMVVQIEPYSCSVRIIDEEIEIAHGTLKTRHVRTSSPVVATRIKV